MNSGSTGPIVLTAEDLKRMEAEEPKARAALAASIREGIPEVQRIAHYVEMAGEFYSESAHTPASANRLIAQQIRNGDHNRDEFLLKLQEKLNKEFFR